MTIARLFIFSLLAVTAFAEPAKVAVLDKATLPAPTVQRDDEGEIVIKSAAEGTTVLYTLDGSDPIANSNPYLAPIFLPWGGHLKARAFSADRKVMSEVVERKLNPAPGFSARPSTVIPVTQDRSWPSYDWQKRHEALVASVQKQKPALLFIGDSITHFFGGEKLDLPLRGPNTWDEFYAPRNAANIGFGWDKTENVLWRLTHGEIDNIEPKVAVVMIGTNNTGTCPAGEIVEGITAICQTLNQKLQNTKILLLAIFPRGAPDNPARPKIAEINAALSKLDGKDNVTFLDIGPKFLQPDGTISKDIMPDLLHPNEKGYRIWAEAMEPTLKKLLGE
ncbi:MAG: chitobiase/beta-hexosaminidase C-terminal domain-containing protein [Verrucomicrobiaceae bacterium]|nr:chitobiase/beta-hexosaminidase C-terminal domain-containing protein [Verrucomicrobiaceae bacterium]